MKSSEEKKKAKAQLAARERRSQMPGVKAVGRPFAPWKDIYHWVLTASWPRFYAIVFALFVTLNAIFASIYASEPGSIANARPGSFEDHFFFSVQTIATIGYGGMFPQTRLAHVAVMFESLIGVVLLSLITGITFARFAKPRAMVLFSDKICIAYREGGYQLLLRMANARHNQIVDAQLGVQLLVSRKTSDGQQMRTPIELTLVRNRTAVFFLSWTAIHKIEPGSPFYGEGAMERLRAENGQILATLTGLDETVSQPVHARCTFEMDDIVWDARFADILKVLPDGTRVLDYTRFHEVEAIEGPPTIS